MNYKTFLKIKKHIPVEKDESMAHYFERVAVWIEKYYAGMDYIGG